MFDVLYQIREETEIKKYKVVHVVPTMIREKKNISIFIFFFLKTLSFQLKSNLILNSYLKTSV